MPQGLRSVPAVLKISVAEPLPPLPPLVAPVAGGENDRPRGPPPAPPAAGGAGGAGRAAAPAPCSSSAADDRGNRACGERQAAERREQISTGRDRRGSDRVH